MEKECSDNMLCLEALADFLRTKIGSTVNMSNMLVVGCGEGRYEFDLPIFDIFGIDICDEKLRKAINKGYMVAKQDIRNLSNFLDKSFNVVIAMDVIEHLTKEDGLKLKSEMERIAKDQVVIFVPVQTDLGKWESTPEEQEKLIQNGGDAGFHLSTWDEKDFEGYEVYYNPTFHGDFGALLAIKKFDGK